MVGLEIEANAAQAGHSAQQAVAGKLLVHPEHALFEPHGVHVRGHERHVGANRANVRNVVVETFQLQADRAQRAGARRRLGPRSALDGVAESGCVREARIAGDALRQANTVRDGQGLEKLLKALVHVKHAQLQIEHRLARHAE